MKFRRRVSDFIHRVVSSKLEGRCGAVGRKATLTRRAPTPEETHEPEQAVTRMLTILDAQRFSCSLSVGHGRRSR